MKANEKVSRAFGIGWNALLAGGLDMTMKQEELAEQYGTPEQFEKAIWKAYADLFITGKEARAAIGNYNNEWPIYQLQNGSSLRL